VTARQQGQCAEIQGAMVSSRLVLMFPGFEPLPAEGHCRRFLREAAKTAPHYGMTLSPSAVTAERRSASAVGTGRFSVKASGDGWATDTEVVIYELSELNEDYAARDPVSRFALGLVALADFVVTGTFFRYLSTGWRYGLFFIFPLLVVVGAAIAAWLGYLIGSELFPQASRLAGSTAAIAAGLLALFYAQRQWNFMLAMDDWAVARDLARGRKPELAARFALLSADVARRCEASKAEEILFSSHSFGAVAAVMALADTARAGRGAERAGLLTVGSSLLKIALHPGAKRLCAAVETIVEANCPWLDVQSLTDLLNFYGTNPAELVAGRSGSNQNTTRVRFRNQLEPATYRSIRRDFFRVHRQFVYGVERRSHYAYHAILCGPEPFPEVARRGGLLDDWSGFARETENVGRK
jgi:hypothetical protein